MAQTPEGALKSAAKWAGITPEEFRARRASGLKRCSKCKAWRDVALFDRDRTRGDGKSTKCRPCVRVADPYSSVRGKPGHNLGKKYSPQACANISAAQKAKPSRPMLGRKHSLESRKKMSQTRRERGCPRGPDAPGYIDGKALERRGERVTEAYKRWRYDVFTRDRFTCQRCGDSSGGNLHAHHIKGFATHPALRLVLSNGVTLCRNCHIAVHARALSHRPAPWLEAYRGREPD